VQRVARLRKCFAGLYSLEEGESEEAVRDALVRPENFVMKPQREGGGNNLYGDKLRHALSTMSPQERAAHILMQRIKPSPYEAYLLRKGVPLLVQAICELGIFSVYVRKGDVELINEDGGHLLRTKTATSDEGGVASGFAVLDSPYLIN
jgi:glutathione synthetase